MLACAGREKVRNPYVYPDYRRIGGGLSDYLFIVGDCEPPRTIALIERYAAIDRSSLLGLFVFECLFMILSQLYRDE